MLLAGVDGCKGGWLCVTEHNGTVKAHVATDFDEVIALNAAIATIDIPIGLPDQGARPCDREARRLLKAPRASSVFAAPVRSCLEAGSYLEACVAHQRADGRKLSRQAYGILPKIREVDARMRADPALQQRIREVHPELCFATWNGGPPMKHKKSRAAGREERTRLVEHEWPGAMTLLAASLPRGSWAWDDLLDAYAALWTARRIALGSSLQVPAEPPADRFGLRMAMTA